MTRPDVHVVSSQKQPRFFRSVKIRFSVCGTKRFSSTWLDVIGMSDLKPVGIANLRNWDLKFLVPTLRRRYNAAKQFALAFLTFWN